LHTIFTLRPRHDFFQWIFQTARTFVDLHYRPADDIQLDFKLSPGALQDGFVWAIVAKDELLSVKSNRWDLVGTFSKCFFACNSIIHRHLPKLRRMQLFPLLSWS
jgi:hypothetical protein